MIRLRVLGESVVEVDRHRVGPEAATLFALALYLAFERDAHVTRQSLIDLLWPDSAGESGRHCLRQTLYKLRQLGAPLQATASHVELPGAAVTGDFLELDAGAPIDAERLRRAGSGFGEFLPGYAPRLSPRYTEWLEQRRAHVQSIVRRALAGALLDLRARHRWSDVEVVARQYLRLDPLNEEATLALAEATALTGSKAQALSMLDSYLGELGPGASEIRLPATLLRRRIAERVPDRRYAAAAEACFEGREESMEVLAGLLREARAGRGQACLIWGEPGIGKTRLAAECTKAAVLQGAQVARVGCEASDARRPLSLFVDAVPLLLNLRGALGCSPGSMAYLRRLTEHDPSAPTPSDAALDADFLFARIRRSIFDLVDAVAGEGTLVFVVEDVHWLDQTSWDVLRAMIDWAATRKVLFLFTSRAEQPASAPEDARSLRLVRHRLGAISEDAAGRLLDRLCQGSERTLGTELREWYVRVAEGNPLFLRELAREWVGRGRHDRIPASLAGVLEDRIRKLSPTALRLLQVSALLGKHASLARVELITDYRRYELIDGAVALEQASLLSPEPGSIRPRHELIANTALKYLGTTSLRMIHRNIAVALSREIHSQGSAQLLWDCVEHWQLADEINQLPALVSACAAILVRMGLPRDAAALFDTAATYELSASDKHAMLKGKVEPLRLAGLWNQVAGALRQVIVGRATREPLATEHCPEELELLEAEFRQAGTTLGMLEKAIECANDVRAPAAHRLAACVIAIRFADRTGDHQSAKAIHSLATAAAASGIGHTNSDLATCELIYHASFGDLSKARRISLELVNFERENGTPFTLCQALRYTWIPLMRLGELDQARSAAGEAFAIAEQYQLSSAALSAADSLADTFLEDGRLEEAARWCSIAAQWAESFEDAYLQSEQRRTHARLHLMQGREDEARLLIPGRPDDLAPDDEIRRYSNALSLSLRLSVGVCSGDEIQRALDSMSRLHERTRDLGGQDFSTWCLCDALENTGQRKRAHSVLKEYALEHRRELGKIPYYLSQLIERCALRP